MTHKMNKMASEVLYAATSMILGDDGVDTSDLECVQGLCEALQKAHKHHDDQMDRLDDLVAAVQEVSTLEMALMIGKMSIVVTPTSSRRR